MSTNFKLAQSADLVSGLITRMGKTAYASSMAPNAAQAQHLRSMIFRCTTCSEKTGCAALQASSLSLDGPPAFCPNAEAFTALPDA